VELETKIGRLEQLTTYPTTARQMETLKAQKDYAEPHRVQLYEQNIISMGHKHVMFAFNFGVEK
jgi:hypothetical protein